MANIVCAVCIAGVCMLQARSQCWMSSSIAVLFTVLRQSFSLNLELIDWLGGLASEPLGLICL